MTANARKARGFDYIRDPQAIYALSFERIRAETDLTGFGEAEARIAVRAVHACGNPQVAEDLVFNGDVAGVTQKALADGAPIITDSRMTEAAIIRRNLPGTAQILCPLTSAETESAAKAFATTRSAAAMRQAAADIPGSVVVIGNAPTALFSLLELIEEGIAPPAALFAFPVGFVGARESKDALIETASSCAFVTLRGRLGGSAIAGAAFNAVFTEERAP